MAANRLKISELVLRDGHQSLLATRMRTEHMLPICERLDEIGFWSVEMWGGATFDACIRFLNEDPFERVRKLKKMMPKTPFQMLLRGQNLVGYRHYADDLVAKFVELSAEAGIDVFRIFDALNDTRNLEASVKATLANGKHAQGAISYTVSPVHNNKLFVEMAKRLEDMGCASICIKDMAGLLAPYQARDLIGSIKNEVKLPLHLHSHTTSGYALMTMMVAIESGIDIIDTVLSPLAMGASHSPTETIVSALKGTERDTGLDIDKLVEAADYFAGVKKEYSAFLSSFTGVDVSILKSQVPGGMISNLESQLKQQNAIDRLDDALKELPATRKDLGYPPLVTPTSQIVGTQAVLNVLMGRFKNISKETQGIIEGKYGATPAPVDPELVKRVCGDSKPITCRPADLLEPEWEKLKKEVKEKHGIESEEDVITFALFPQIAKKYIDNRGEPPTEIFKKEDKPAAPPALASATGGAKRFKVTINGVTYDALVDEAEASAPTAAGAPAAPAPTVSASAPTSANGGEPVKSPLAGAIWKISKSVGDQVKEGETVLILEAMKMENEIKSPKSGSLASIDVKEGDSVGQGDQLFSIR